MSKDPTVSDKWDRRFLELANFVAAWSKDPSTKVGAVIVRADRTVASMGFNGFPRGVLDREDRYADRATKYAMVVHAENNALINARQSLEGYTLYVTPLPPCTQCAAAIIQCGIARVVIEQKEAAAANKDKLAADWAKQFEISATMFEEAGVKVAVVRAADARGAITLGEPA